MTKIDVEWLKAFDEAMLSLFAIDHSDAGMDGFLLGFYADLPPRDAALVFSDDYDLDRDDALWPQLGAGTPRLIDKPRTTPSTVGVVSACRSRFALPDKY